MWWHYYNMYFCSSLVYIAGLCYQWLKNDMLSQDLLRMGEIILLKVYYNPAYVRNVTILAQSLMYCNV